MYFSQFSLYSKFQSAYRKNYSTETALLRVRNDVLQAMDRHRQVILVLLDLTAAFDTLDHSLLLHRLEYRFGVRGAALNWFESYLSDRLQQVVIGNFSSSESVLECGVPQGSVLGPFLFTLYSSPLEDIILSHDLGLMLFADDIQLYLECDCAVESAARVENCIDDIRAWMAENRLVLNDNKTEVIHFHSRHSRKMKVLEKLRVGITTHTS